MKASEHEIYEDARSRVKQKKLLFFHFVVFILGSAFMYIANEYLIENPTSKWYKWAIAIWGFLFILHFIKVFIVDSFMNKKWERKQIDRLMVKQNKRIKQLDEKIKKEYPEVSTEDNSEENSEVV